MAVKPPKLFVREFLNIPPHYSLAAAFARIDRNGYPELKLSDCGHIVSFDLYGDSGDACDEDGQREYDNTFHKLDTIISTVQSLRNELAKQARKQGWQDPKRVKK
jgi:hypothetical protein